MYFNSPIKPEAMVHEIYGTLSASWGSQHWWPAETPFAVIVGAILTQNTSWTNVERALASLRQAGILSIEGIRTTPLPELERFVRSSGYYRQKADRLKRFVEFLDQRYDGSLEKMFVTPTQTLRAELLSLKGVGDETADAILLYAGNHEIFVVDAYARRILLRHGAISDNAKYNDVRMLVENGLRGTWAAKAVAAKGRRPAKMVVHEPSAVSTAGRSPIAQVYNEMHGLLVQVGKHYCLKAAPNCLDCPLRCLLPDGHVWLKPELGA
jgi:endonuclease-3 related protein